MCSYFSEVGRNIWFASLSTIVPAVFTFIFWFTTARLVGPEGIGIASTIASITMVISSFVILDTNLSMKRYLGIANSKKNYEYFKHVIFSTMVFVTLTLITCLILLILLNQYILLFGNTEVFFWYMLLLLPFMSIQMVLAEALISSLNSKKLILPQIIGSILRFPLIILFVFVIKEPVIGTVISYSFFFVICTFSYSYSIYRDLKKYPLKLDNFFSTIREILLTGLASWLPHIISIIGSQLSIISVYTIQGSVEAGKFYLPLAIFTISLFIVNGITRVGHPLIAGMDSIESQKNFVYKSIYLAFQITIPLSTPLLIFSSQFLTIMGNDYSSAAGSLSLFLLGLPFSIVSEIYYYHEYGLGRRSSLLKLGLSSNAPRVILYFLLIPWIGQIGASLAYTVGSIIQFIVTMALARRQDIVLPKKRLILITFIPYALGIVFWLTTLNFLISSSLIILLSFIVYVRLGLTSEEGSIRILNTILPMKAAKIVIPRVRILMKFIR